jgi:hypothetical protein
MPLEEQTYREGIKEDLLEIKTMVRYTNGKVKKIVIALTLLAGVVIGQTFSSPHDIIQLLVSAL